MIPTCTCAHQGVRNVIFDLEDAGVLLFKIWFELRLVRVALGLKELAHRKVYYNQPIN